ncbi:MAG: transporter permease DctQ [candidate division NC10 bacterium]|jgi:TRAP-type mannitol/chloroaromatic compound transport system permease small subunit|nr:transporter permease DctQ [candidate division NC10 bacterium]
MTSHGSTRRVLPATPFTRLLEGVIDFCVLVCGWWLLALSALTCVEILGRKLFGFSLQGVDEVGSYTYAVVTTFGFSYGLVSGAHTRVDFLLSRFSVRGRALLNATAMITLAAMAALAVYRAWDVLTVSRALFSTAPTPLATPLWYPQSFWFVAWGLFSFTTLLAATQAFRLLLARNYEEINVRYGPQTLEEEVESESAVHLK